MNDEIEAFFLPDLADDDPRGPHPQRLLDEPTKLHFPGALKVGLPGLHGHHIRERHAKLEYFLACNDTLVSRNRSRETVQQRGLPHLSLVSPPCQRVALPRSMPVSHKTVRARA